MQRRRELMAMQNNSELYPIGTDVITKYIGRDSAGYAYFVSGKQLNSNGEYVDGSGNNAAASPVFIPVKDSYGFHKSAHRLYTLAQYDINYSFLGSAAYGTLEERDIAPLLPGTAYIRLASHKDARSNWLITLVRNA